MILTLILVSLLTLAIILFFKRKTFGANPEGKRQARIEQSKHFTNGSFENESPTEVMLKDASFVGILIDFFSKPKNTEPDAILPSIRTDLISLKDSVPNIVWFGHSSYLIKYKGKNILVDPVLSGSASPVSFFGKSFPGSDAYSVKDFPNIDVLIITHDHYDHLDYETVVALKDKIKKVYTPLGVGAHLEHWGFQPDQIVELDWWDETQVSEEIKLTTTPARHFSGRSFSRGKTLWASFVLQLDHYNIFVGGDSGYDTHFKTIGDKYGPFDMAILEAGQYGTNWPYIHMVPEETVQATKDLNAKVLLPVHWAKFSLALHAWDEPINRVLTHAQKEQVQTTTPLIGEAVQLGQPYPHSRWWRK